MTNFKKNTIILSSLLSTCFFLPIQPMTDFQKVLFYLTSIIASSHSKCTFNEKTGAQKITFPTKDNELTAFFQNKQESLSEEEKNIVTESFTPYIQKLATKKLTLLSEAPFTKMTTKLLWSFPKSLGLDTTKSLAVKAIDGFDVDENSAPNFSYMIMDYSKKNFQLFLNSTKIFKDIALSPKHLQSIHLDSIIEVEIARFLAAILTGYKLCDLKCYDTDPYDGRTWSPSVNCEENNEESWFSSVTSRWSSSVTCGDLFAYCPEPSTEIFVYKNPEYSSLKLVWKLLSSEENQFEAIDILAALILSDINPRCSTLKFIASLALLPEELSQSPELKKFTSNLLQLANENERCGAR